MARRRPKPDDPEINITPMLDIVFIMLIFFIVTTSFTRDTGAMIERPEAEQATELVGGTILIGVRPNDEIWMANRQVELHEVQPLVERTAAENPEGGVVIVADKGARIGRVTQVMDQIRQAGVDGVAIAAEQAAR
jgi:biopolymer transport protein ExbD